MRLMVCQRTKKVDKRLISEKERERETFPEMALGFFHIVIQLRNLDRCNRFVNCFSNVENQQNTNI